MSEHTPDYDVTCERCGTAGRVPLTLAWMGRHAHGSPILRYSARVIPPALTAPERDRAAEVEAAEDRAEQAAFDASRERR